MALQTYTLTNLQDACKHATGVTTPATGNSYTNVVNDAIQYLASMRPWPWRQDSLSLNLTQDQNYVDLPADFAQLQVLHRSGNFKAARAVSLDKLILYRAGGLGSIPDAFLAYCVVGKEPASVTALPTYKLELFPTPAASETAALVGIYLRQIPTVSSGTDVPAVPGQWQSPLLSLVRAFAQSYENETPLEQTPDWPIFMAKIEPLFGESCESANLGQMEGGIEGVSLNDAWLYPRQISQS